MAHRTKQQKGLGGESGLVQRSPSRRGTASGDGAEQEAGALGPAIGEGIVVLDDVFMALGPGAKAARPSMRYKVQVMSTGQVFVRRGPVKYHAAYELIKSQQMDFAVEAWKKNMSATDSSRACAAPALDALRDCRKSDGGGRKSGRHSGATPMDVDVSALYTLLYTPSSVPSLGRHRRVVVASSSRRRSTHILPGGPSTWARPGLGDGLVGCRRRDLHGSGAAAAPARPARRQRRRRDGARRGN
jgi:hypothetical protein